MPRLTTLVSLLIASILSTSILAANTQPTVQSLGKMPLAFTKNLGQWDDRVLYRTNSGGATIWITKDGITYQFMRDISRGTRRVPGAFGIRDSSWAHAMRPYGSDAPASIDQLVITARFVDANPNPEIVADGQMEYKCNYFLGNDPTKWHTNVPNYEAVTLKDFYPGVDLKLSSDANNQATYEFTATPGADNSKVKVTFEGVEDTSIDADRGTVLKTKWGEMVVSIGAPTNAAGPVSPHFIANEGKSTSVVGESQSLSGERGGALTLGYSTFLGGELDEEGKGIAVDNGGCVYVTGTTHSTDFPILNPFQLNHHGGYWHNDAFITKMDANGSHMIYSTFLGGTADDYVGGIAVDSRDGAYVTGYTASGDFPTLNPFQTDRAEDDVFVAKLNRYDGNLLYSTYLGGSAWDNGYGIAVDTSGCAYVTGYAFSSDFPTTFPPQAVSGIFVTKFSCSGNSVIYSTRIVGGSASSIAVDNMGQAYITGVCTSPGFPIVNAFQPVSGGDYDAFVSKLSVSGGSFVYSTYLGGGGVDQGDAIAVDDRGNAYVTGYTESSSNFPIKSSVRTYQGRRDAFVTKICATGDSLVFSTYLGGWMSDGGQGIAVDVLGNSVVTGYTMSPDFPLLHPFQSFHSAAYADAFVTELSSSGDSLVYSTYLGGRVHNGGHGIVFGAIRNAFVVGTTSSFDFPVLDPCQMYHGGSDAFVTKLVWTPDYPCGDANTDETVDLQDAVFLINYIFAGGPAPQQMTLGDVDCSGSINIADAVRLIIYLFSSGPAPCSECE
jgi:hypothetical protein